MRSLLVSLLALGFAGCFLDHADDDQPPHEACPALAELVLDPTTGTCTAVGPAGCDDRAGAPNSVDYASCHSTCDNLGEAACLDADGCRAGFLLNADAPPQYWTCWATAPSGPDHSTACTGLSADECSRHDNCASNYLKHGDGTTTFDSCDGQPGV